MTGASQLQIGTARRVEFDLPTQRIAALQSGERGARPALLVPGYTGSKEDFGPILDPLAAAGFLVTAIDLPGQLDSPGFAEPADYTPDRLARVVCELAAQLADSTRPGGMAQPDGRVLLLGHSFGGLVARAAVIAEPARFASLVLLGSGPARIDGQRRMTMDQLDPVLASAGVAAVYAAMQAEWEKDPGYVAPAPDLASFLERRFLSGTPAMLKGMADALRDEPDRVEHLRATGVPVSVLHGADDDAWLPPLQHAMAQRLGANYVVIPDAAHSPAVENPAATAAALIDLWT
ncbi:MAG TPA: alpha/beta hydrolase [Jatrophihabitans sp.]|nr:alpha/beta hydrolase [Jatrophihabitans sp.]